MGLQHGVENAISDGAKAAAETTYQKNAALLKKQNEAYNDFCEENDLTKRSERITIVKWDRSQAAKARAAARQYEKSMVLHSKPPYTQENLPLQLKMPKRKV